MKGCIAVAAQGLGSLKLLDADVFIPPQRSRVGCLEPTTENGFVDNLVRGEREWIGEVL